MAVTDVAEGAVVGGAMATVGDGVLAGVDDEVPTGAALAVGGAAIEGGAEVVGTTGDAQPATNRVRRIDG